ncbi:hypothetical protein BVRB_9g208600 [Beta vulgaris subsp. vulgaris]|nr:hypothetical protein BVRB_9g208600 [Beta vulgaris subsp. vulgaris]
MFCCRSVAVIFGCWRRHEMVLPATLLLLVAVAVTANRCFSFSSSCRLVDVVCAWWWWSPLLLDVLLLEVLYLFPSFL